MTEDDGHVTHTLHMSHQQLTTFLHTTHDTQYHYITKYLQTGFPSLSPSSTSPPRDTSVISRLRSSTSLPRPISQTKKFQSFLNFALNKYQSPL